MDCLSIELSPNSYRRVQNDEAFMMKVTEDVLCQQKSSYNQVIFKSSETEIEESATGDIAKAIDTSEEANANWYSAPIKLMLALIEDLWPKVGKSINVKTRGKMYQIIAEKMAAEGYCFSSFQIENKFRGLERAYKKIVLHNRQTGRDRKTCAYESELQRILGEKKGIHPEFLLESGDIEGMSCSSASIEDNSDTDHSRDDVQGPVDSLQNKPKNGVRQKIMDKMDKMLEEKKNFHSKVLDIMQKRDERAQKREERCQRKLELLEMLVKK